MIFNLTRLRAAICLFSFSGFLPALNVKTSPDAYWEKSRRNDIPSEMGQLIYNYNLHWQLKRTQKKGAAPDSMQLKNAMTAELENSFASSFVR